MSVENTENTNNIDDLLLNLNKEKESSADIEPEAENFNATESEESSVESDYQERAPESEDVVSDESDESDEDEYGNKVSKEQEHAKPTERYYTQAEVQQMMQERLERQARNMQKQALDNDSDAPDFQQQLKAMIENAVTEVHQKNVARQQQEIEARRQYEFEEKFRRGATRFKDFNSVVADKPISDYMLQATSGMNDPSGFIYAACKRAPEEIERISKIENPYAQVVEIAKLESKLKSGKATTKAPRPIKSTRGDSITKSSPDRPVDILAASDSERWQRMQRR